MFGGVAEIPIAHTFAESVEMDFVDYGNHAAFLHIQDTLSRFPAIISAGAKKRKNKRKKWPGGR